MENTSRPWVLVAVGICALLSVAILWRRFSASPSDETLNAQRLAQAIAEKERDGVGWAGSTASGVAEAEGAGDSNSGANAGGTRGIGSKGSGAALAVADGDSARRSGVAAGMRRNADGSLVLDSSLTDGSLKGTAAERLARQSREARARAVQAGGSVAAVDPENPDQIAEPDKPVFSAFQDGKLDVDSDDAPVAADNVESKDGFVMFGEDSQVVVPDAGNLSGPAGSISFWVKPEWEGSEKADAHMLDLSTPNVWENRLAVNKNGRYLRFMFFPNTGQEVGVSSIIDDWQPNQEHHVVATWGPVDGGGNVLQFYVDGRLVGTDQYDGEFEVPTNQNVILGNNRSGKLGARGGMSGLEFYPNQIPYEKVSSLYSSRAR